MNRLMLILTFLFSFQYSTLCAQEKKAEDFAGTSQGLQEMMRYVTSLNRKEQSIFTNSLRPSLEDFKAVFLNENFAKKEYAYHKRLLRSVYVTVKPLLAEQTETVIWKTSAGELKTYTGQAIYFPGGYKEIADELNPDLTYYRLKFVEPGRQTGSGFDMFVYVNEKWLFFPRPWSMVVLEKG